MTDPTPTLPGAPSMEASPHVLQSQRPAGMATLVWLGAAAAILLWLCYRIVYPFLPAMFGAVVFAVAMSPLQNRILTRVRGPGAAALLVTGLVLVLVILPIGYLAANLGSQVNDLYQWLSQQAEHSGGWKILASETLQEGLDWISAKTGISTPNLRKEILARAQAFSSGLVEWGGSVVGNFLQTFLTVMLMLLILFFLLRDGAAWIANIGNWIPLPPHRYQQLLQACQDSIFANLYGTGAVALAQGGLLGLSFAFVGIPSALLWAVITAFISLIPVLGSFLIWVPAAVWLGLTGHVGKAIFIAAWGFGVVSMVDNFLRPYIMSGRVNMSTLPIFFSLLGGIQLFGFIGLFAGPVVFALTSVVVQILYEEIRARNAALPQSDPPLQT